MPTIGAILQDANDTVLGATRTVGALTQEVERLRELLAAARDGLKVVRDYGCGPFVERAAVRALRRSDPDATPATVGEK